MRVLRRAGLHRGNIAPGQQALTLPLAIASHQHRHARIGFGGQQGAAAAVRETAGPIDPDLAAHCTNRLQHLGTNEFGIAPAGDPLDDQRDQFGCRVVILIDAAGRVSQRIFLKDDPLVIGVEIGPAPDIVRLRRNALRQQPGAHIKKLANEDARLGRALPFGQEIADRLVERFDLAQHDGPADSQRRDRLGQRFRHDFGAGIGSTEIGGGLHLALVHHHEGIAVVGLGIGGRRSQRGWRDAGIAGRRQWARRGADDRFQRVITAQFTAAAGGNIGEARCINGFHICGIGRRVGSGGQRQQAEGGGTNEGRRHGIPRRLTGPL